MFSDLAGRFKPEHLPNCTDERFAVDVSIARRDEDEVWGETRVRLQYTAPRLRRDGLRKGADEDLERVAWIQPMTAALNLPEPTVQDFSKCAVSLMPERTASGELRVLLNFPVTLDPQRLRSAIGKQAHWENQFVAFGRGEGEQRFFLRWPAEMSSAQRNSRPWWRKLDSFTCLAVDLGQRDAGAFGLLDVRAN